LGDRYLGGCLVKVVQQLMQGSSRYRPYIIRGHIAILAIYFIARSEDKWPLAEGEIRLAQADGGEAEPT
jgi:hypothetical protein